MTQRKIIGKKSLIAVLALLLVIGAFAFVYHQFSPKGVTGAKTITVQVIQADGAQKEHQIKTDAAYLRGALEQEKMVQGEEGPFGIFVKTVDGYTVDDGKQEWWCFTKGGGTLETSVDSTPIADGDHFEITLTVGYDT